jgi:hypothetical protein
MALGGSREADRLDLSNEMMTIISRNEGAKPTRLLPLTKPDARPNAFSCLAVDHEPATDVTNALGDELRLTHAANFGNVFVCFSASGTIV